MKFQVWLRFRMAYVFLLNEIMQSMMPGAAESLPSTVDSCEYPYTRRFKLLRTRVIRTHYVIRATCLSCINAYYSCRAVERGRGPRRSGVWSGRSSFLRESEREGKSESRIRPARIPTGAKSSVGVAAQRRSDATARLRVDQGES